MILVEDLQIALPNSRGQRCAYGAVDGILFMAREYRDWGGKHNHWRVLTSSKPVTQGQRIAIAKAIHEKVRR